MVKIKPLDLNKSFYHQNWFKTQIYKLQTILNFSKKKKILKILNFKY